MRLLLQLLVVSAANAALFTSFTPSKKPPDDSQRLQQPLMPVVPNPKPNSPTPDASTGLVIADALAQDRRINIFAGFTQDVDSVSDRLEDGSKNATVLCPENEEIRKLPRKPWEDPKDYAAFGAQAYDGPGGKGRADQNLKRFVEAHIVPCSPWKQGEKVKALAGNTVWYEVKDGKKIIHPGGIEVLRSEGAVDNGEVWVLNGVLNYA